MGLPIAGAATDGLPGPFSEGVRVAVVVPTSNRARMLHDVVGALWAQTLDPREFEVLVDNCFEGETPKANRVVDCDDMDLAWRVQEPGYRNVFVPEALVWHWILQGQLCWRQLPKLAAQIGFLAARQAAICAGMIYRSVRFRTVVL